MTEPSSFLVRPLMEKEGEIDETRKKVFLFHDGSYHQNPNYRKKKDDKDHPKEEGTPTQKKGLNHGQLSSEEIIYDLFGSNSLEKNTQTENQDDPFESPEKDQFLHHHDDLTPSSSKQFISMDVFNDIASSHSDIILQIEYFQNLNLELQKKLEESLMELEELQYLKNRPKEEEEKTFSTWHSFHQQQQFAISVWQRNTQESDGTLESSLVLVECNPKFAELLGYPINFLHHKFTLKKMICEYARIDLINGGTSFIMTASGSKKVSIHIDSQHTNDFYTLRMKEIL